MCWGMAVIPADDTEKAGEGRENYKDGISCAKAQ